MNQTSSLTPGATTPPVEEVRYTLWQRVQIATIAAVGALALRLIGATLRATISPEEGAPTQVAKPVAYCFWHECIFASVYLFRGQGIRVMTSRSFDGEYIARIIERFGYVAVRGSSSRGGVEALRELHRDAVAGDSVAFTIDGPRGPRRVAKPGPVLLSRNTQVPIVCFYVAASSAWVLRSWDRFIIPKPFSRVVIRSAREIRVPPDADLETSTRYHAEMQAALERVRIAAEQEIGIAPSS